MNPFLQKILALVVLTIVIGTAQAGEPRDLRSDTWVATDALGRSLPIATGWTAAAR